MDNQLCSKVLTLSPTELSRECGLSVLLPVGRLNGLHNMITVIQDQISCELKRIAGDQVNQITEVVELSKVVSKKDYESKIIENDTSDEIAVLLSGGVDSSVALKLLQLQVHHNQYDCVQLLSQLLALILHQSKAVSFSK